ncbi:pseudouridine synthase [Rivibacter subsaxonicus]|uniref:tRNA pseudouridine synthase C n=1 Tax=Rivibacter subsaxonicus TaxID=457575 RepID=A0A4Q7W1R0_9BURK|nr:pseudouridine synthase [Rivibacter subsaxonicus]RZU03100.1 tRNA pseudouridine synthase C [Rivibacter subsaxonicus]
MSPPRPIPVLHDDGSVLSVHKPAGLLVHRSALDAHETDTLMRRLLHQTGHAWHAVHRLDKGTSGVLLLARDAVTARALGAAFASEGAVRKHYLAFVRGWPPQAVGVDHALRPDDAPKDAPAQEARTLFEALAQMAVGNGLDRFATSRYGLVRAQPLSGRRHQIRRHLKHLAHPVIGDATHGKGVHNRWWAAELGITRLWLHALELELAHPDGGTLHVVSPIGAAWNADWQRLLAHPAWSQPVLLSPPPAPGPPR